ncbi:MAG: DNA-protecting protein DprA [Nitrospirae bacterium]|nr:DNA-protecting protein DprA [Nitrospirota bacterium]
MNKTRMRDKLTKDNERPDCHPEYISGFQSKSGSVISSRHYPWLALAHILKNRYALSKNLIERFSSPEQVFSSSFEELCRAEGITPAIAWEIKSFRHPSADIENELKKIDDAGIKLIHFNHPDYPAGLRNIYDPPLYFYMNGTITPEDTNALAVVGSRSPSPYGIKVTEMLTERLSSAGFTVVSGMARGIDSAAHRTALKTGGRSIAVLGCGADIAYPRENAGLMREIIGNGAIISEFPLGTRPDKKHFPQRNRIISGLSRGVIVVEAAEKSGSLITARFAMEQGREIFAVPGNINSPLSKGANNLIKQGAKAVTSVNDVLEEFEQLLTLRQKHGINILPDEPDSMSDEEKNIYRTLTLEPKHINQVITESGIETRRVIQLLLNLELNGRIEQLPGSCYVRSALNS